MIWFSDHAVQRYQERLRPGLDLLHARNELTRLADAGQVTPNPPGWAQTADGGPFLILGPDVCLPLVPKGRNRLVATTVLTRDSLKPADREQRHRERRIRRHARHHRNGIREGSRPPLQMVPPLEPDDIVA